MQNDSNTAAALRRPHDEVVVIVASNLNSGVPPHAILMRLEKDGYDTHEADQIIAQAERVRAGAREKQRPRGKAKDADARVVHVATLEDFAAKDEAGANALLGDAENALIPEGGDVVVYGDGGAGKTSLTNDGGFHFAAGDQWLGIPVARALKVLLVENEGPRPLFRQKLARKLAAWTGGPLEGRLGVFDEPWGAFSFADESWRGALAATIKQQQTDVLIAGPVTRLGMDEAGTLQQVRDFMGLVQDVRVKAGRLLTVILVHHQNKAGTVSGAWEGSGDTLLHVEARGPGVTHLHIEKARWSSEDHGRKLDLVWAAGEGFTVKDERDYALDIERLLSDGEPRTVDAIRAPRDSSPPGIGASRKNVQDTLETRADLFVAHAGADIGRSKKGVFWTLKKLPV
jgi:hypothetical protein